MVNAQEGSTSVASRSLMITWCMFKSRLCSDVHKDLIVGLELLCVVRVPLRLRLRFYSLAYSSSPPSIYNDACVVDATKEPPFSLAGLIYTKPQDGSRSSYVTLVDNKRRVA